MSKKPIRIVIDSAIRQWCEFVLRKNQEAQVNK